MNERDMLENIDQALKTFEDGKSIDNARNLLKTLGYDSPKKMDLDSNLPDDFVEDFREYGELNKTRAMIEEWETIDFLFQLREEDIFDDDTSEENDNDDSSIDKTRIESYLFFAIKLRQDTYNRTQLSTITREINKILPMPAMILFQHGETLTLAVIDRRLHRRDQTRDVLKKVTLIKDIDFKDTHPAHLRILFDLSRNELHRVHQFSNFVALHEAWKKTLDIQELNKRFYKELSDWYFWAVDNVTFPDDAGDDVEIRNATSVIRMITRLIFVWFIKERNLVPDDFFNQREIGNILNNTDPDESTYYKAILQNLFFATLNQEMNTPQKPNNRKFRGENRQHYNITSLYRYKRYFSNPDDALRKFETIPFLNGGLFECLDKKEDEGENTVVLRIDGYSDRDDNQLVVPNFLFFSEEKNVDLNQVYGTRGKRYKVRGLIDILQRYKFTITENTPIEEEVALDPELLGKVFENLLAAYNPETQTTARKQTGSYYTPREIVNYMVEESLIAYLKNKLIDHHNTHRPDVELTDELRGTFEKNLRHLVAYNDELPKFNTAQIDELINAIDAIKILDPACGSGAFPMGILQKLVFILSKLDPNNEKWKQRQIEKVENTIREAEKIDDSTIRERTIRELESEKDNIENAFSENQLDYGRKLYLIENCIYGVDIQPIAAQIAKLRFFISLVIDQRIDDTKENRGVRPLPNLETKFVAGDTLIGINRPGQMALRGDDIVRLENELKQVRKKHFSARTPKTKDKYRTRDKEIRFEISEYLRARGMAGEETEKLAKWDPYDQNQKVDFFDPEWMFGVTNGFDVVIGNPPYIQLQEDNGRLADLYEPCELEVFTRMGDIYCLFYEKGHTLLRKVGHLCYITSNKWMRSGYGKKLRNYFIVNTQPIQLLDFGPGVFDASVDTNILLFQNTNSDSRDFLRAVAFEADFDKQTGNIAQYMQDNGVNMEIPSLAAPWAILSSDELKIKRKIEDVGLPLKEWEISINYGVKTGCNEAFIIDEETRQQLNTQDANSAEFIKPFLSGRDIKRYHAQCSNLYLLFIPWHFPLHDDSTITGASQVAEEQFDEQYPFIYRHLLQFRHILSNRNQSETGIRYEWYAMQRFAKTYYPEFGKEKIVWGNIAYESSFSFSAAGEFINAPANLLTSKNNDIKYLLACMNSNIFTWEFSNLGIPLGHAFEWKKQYVEQIHVPPITEANQQIVTQIEELVDQILEVKQNNPDADTTNLETGIDQLVYELYELTPDEIAIVEGTNIGD